MKIVLVAARKPCFAALLATAGLSLGTAAGAAEVAGEAHDHGGARLGTVEFGVGCNAAVQQDFNRAMALYHSFAWSAGGGRVRSGRRGRILPAAWRTGVGRWSCSTIRSCGQQPAAGDIGQGRRCAGRRADGGPP